MLLHFRFTVYSIRFLFLGCLMQGWRRYSKRSMPYASHGGYAFTSIILKHTVIKNRRNTIGPIAPGSLKPSIVPLMMIARTNDSTPQLGLRPGEEY